MTGNEYQKLAARTINQGLILGECSWHGGTQTIGISVKLLYSVQLLYAA